MAERTPQRAVLHCEADIGSSQFDISIDGMDALQLLGLAEIIKTNGHIALAGQMQHQDAKPTKNGGKIVPFHGTLPS